MQKGLLIFSVLISVSFISFGQMPDIKTNTAIEEQNKSTIYKTFKGQYNLLIAYSEDGYWWSNKQYYEILALKDSGWFRLSLTSRKKKDGSFTKPTIIKKKINETSGEIILNQLQEIGFFTLDRDSLNIKTKLINDSISEHYTTSDGVNYRFEILSEENFRVIEAYEPEYFLEKLPEFKKRQKFIIGRNLYKTIYKNTAI